MHAWKPLMIRNYRSMVDDKKKRKLLLAIRWWTVRTSDNKNPLVVRRSQKVLQLLRDAARHKKTTTAANDGDGVTTVNLLYPSDRGSDVLLAAKYTLKQRDQLVPGIFICRLISQANWKLSVISKFISISARYDSQVSRDLIAHL